VGAKGEQGFERFHNVKVFIVALERPSDRGVDNPAVATSSRWEKGSS